MVAFMCECITYQLYIQAITFKTSTPIDITLAIIGGIISSSSNSVLHAQRDNISVSFICVTISNTVVALLVALLYM